MRIPSPINPFDIERLRHSVSAAEPFPFFSIDNFLETSFAEEVLASYPTYEDALKTGKSFKAVNEKGKVQLTDSNAFAPAVRKLNDVLASPDWLDILSHVMNIPKLLPDDQLIGGGIHQTGPRGHLDVHIDFNFIQERNLHRRLNILIYFNKDWRKEWGGNVELWDKDVRVCKHSFSPIFNRCVVFETNEISFHGVTAVKCPEGNSRKSFAAYYYTVEAPIGWDGTSHTTVFRARPNEISKRWFGMPLENLQRFLQQKRRALATIIKSGLGRK